MTGTPPIVHRPTVPNRYTIKFIPASSYIPKSAYSILSPVFDEAFVVSSAIDYSVAFSVNFVVTNPAIIPPTSTIASSSGYSVVSPVNFIPAYIKTKP